MNNSIIDFKSIFQSLPGNYLILYPDFPKFTVIDSNERRSIENYINTEDCIGKSLFDCLVYTSTAFIAGLADSLQWVIRERKQHQMPVHKILFNDAVEHDCYVINTPVINKVNEIEYIIHHIIDITEITNAENNLKESVSGKPLADAEKKPGSLNQKTGDILDELNFRNTLLEVRTEATPDGVLVVDAKGSVISMNQKFAEIWKLPKDVVDSKDDNLALQHAMTRLVDPQAFIDRVRYLYDHPYERDHEVMHFKDGRMIERYGLPIIAKDGKYYGWVWYVRDITDQINQLFTVEKVRQKVARDLHDDVGATLTSIGLLSQLAYTRIDINIKEAKQFIQKISDNSSQMMEAMADIVWSINPSNDSMQKIISRMREYAITLLEGKNIGFNFYVGESVQGLELNIEVRLDFFLIFKEAINNLIKYSNATFADINIKLDENELIMVVKDNGVGFDMNNYKIGNGLDNMRKRAKQMKGKIEINSAIDKGTSIVLSFPK